MRIFKFPNFVFRQPPYPPSPAWVADAADTAVATAAAAAATVAAAPAGAEVTSSAAVVAAAAAATPASASEVEVEAEEEEEAGRASPVDAQCSRPETPPASDSAGHPSPGGESTASPGEDAAGPEGAGEQTEPETEAPPVGAERQQSAAGQHERAASEEDLTEDLTEAASLAAEARDSAEAPLMNYATAKIVMTKPSVDAAPGQSSPAPSLSGFRGQVLLLFRSAEPQNQNPFSAAG